MSLSRTEIKHLHKSGSIPSCAGCHHLVRNIHDKVVEKYNEFLSPERINGYGLKEISWVESGLPPFKISAV